jgi:hypothetical protein
MLVFAARSCRKRVWHLMQKSIIFNEFPLSKVGLPRGEKAVGESQFE